LDIDGVLNSEKSMKMSYYKDNKDPNHADLPHESHVKWLNKIVEETGAKLVISSTWRIGTHVRMLGNILYLCGVKADVIDKTPTISISGCERGTEIQRWINECGYDITNFIILDDDSDMCHLMDKLVQTNNKFGLTKKEALIAIEMLNKERKGIEENEMKIEVVVSVYDLENLSLMCDIKLSINDVVIFENFVYDDLRDKMNELVDYTDKEKDIIEGFIDDSVETTMAKVCFVDRYNLKTEV